MTWRARFMFIVLLAVCACSGPGRAGASLMPHPDNADAQIEYFVRTPQGQGPWPTVVLLHGAQPVWSVTSGEGGFSFVRYGVLDELSRKGYLAVAVSLPGYGNSNGPDDFAGAYMQHAVSAVIGKLKADRLADEKKIVIEGVSLGAVTAALIAARDPSLAGIVLISGLYDMPSFFAHPKSIEARLLKYRIRFLVGGDDAALRDRSALNMAQNIHATALILNGALDDRTDPRQAQLLAEKINAHGGAAQVHVYPDHGHQIPFDVRRQEVDAFIDAVLKPSI